MARSAIFSAASCVALLFTPPAQAADQFKQAADGAAIDCAVSARELTRFALIDDQFASVSKMSTGTPYNDFSVINEPLRGDIYVSVAESYAARSISFFATTKKGFVYKIACTVEPIPATQIFLTNPAIAADKAADWENETPIQTSAVRLLQAMANDTTADGYEVRQHAGPPVRIGDLSIQLIAEYHGARLAGKVIRVTNHGAKPVTLKEADLAPRDTLAISIVEPQLAPGRSSSAYLVGANGEFDHD